MRQADAQLPSVEELRAAGKAGVFDDRIEDYLPDSVYLRESVRETRTQRAPSRPTRNGAAPKATRGRVTVT